MMKNYFLLIALSFITFFSACEKQEVQEKTIPLNPKSSYLHNYDNEKLSTPLAEFSIENLKQEVDEKETLILTNTSKNAVSYHWDFGNGDTSSEANPDYNYEMHGYYTISLTVTNKDGEVNKTSKEILVLCLFGKDSHDR